MPRLIAAQREFTAGEVSFRVKGRTDNDKYKNGALTLQNFNILPQGPIERRNGSFIIRSVKDPLNPPRLIRFIVSVTQSFLLEFGDKYIRFFTSEAAVADSSNPTQPFEVVTPYTIDEVFQFDVSQSEFSLIITHGNHEQRELTFLATGADAWVLDIFVTSPPPTFEEGFIPAGVLTGAATSGLGVTFTTNVSLFSESDIGRSLEGIGRAGVASIKTFVGATEVTADIIETFETFPYTAGQWLIDLSPLITITFNDVTRAGGIVTVTSDPLTANVFRADFVGNYILVHGGVLQIVSSVAPRNSCECEILKSMSSSDDTKNWTIEVPTWSVERGFPSTVTQAQQRLLFAGTKSEPQTIIASESGIINGFGFGPEDNDALDIEVLSNEISTINWISSAKDIVVGTTGGESTVDISNGILTPDNRQITNRTSYKSDSQIPVTIGSEIIFIQKGDRKIISYLFDFNSDTYKGEDLTFISEQITKGGITQVIYAQEPNKQIYAVTKDGDMLCGTYDREQNVIGFARYTTNGKYIGVQAIPVGEKDQVWVTVQRTISNVTSVFIEVFDSSTGEDSADVFSDSAIIFSNPIDISSATNAEDARFVAIEHGFIVGDRIKFKSFNQWDGIDQRLFTVTIVENESRFSCDYDSSSQPTYEGGARVFKTTTSLTGLEHLNGAEVEIKTDNAAHLPKTVLNGEITLDGEFAEVVVGLEFKPLFETLPLEFDIGQGSMQGQQMRRIRPVLRVDRSIPPNVNGDVNPERIPEFNMDEAVPLFSGDFHYTSGAWGETAQLSISVDGPFPLRLLGIFGTVQGNVK